MTTITMMMTTTATKTTVIATTQKKEITQSILAHAVFYPITIYSGTQSYYIISVTF